RGGGSARDSASGIAFDRAGKVHVTGTFTGDASFGGSTILTSNGLTDFFIASFDATTGSHLGSSGWGGDGSERASGIAVDPVGNIYVTGEFTGSVDFGPRTLTSAGAPDIFIASYPPSYASTG